MPYTNFHDINLDWIIKRVMKAYSPDNPPDSDDIIDTDSGLERAGRGGLRMEGDRSSAIPN